MNTQSTAAQTPAQLVRGYRARIAQSEPGYYDDADVAMWLVEDTADRSWTPSELGRAMGTDTTTAAQHLTMLAAEGHIATCGRGGSWTRYTARRR